MEQAVIESNESIYYFEKASIPKAIAHFSIPMMLGMSASVIYSIINAYFIGFLHNSEMLTAITLTLPIFAILMAFGNLIGVGGGTYISRLLGEKEYQKVKQVSSFSFYSSILLGVVICLVSIPFISSIVYGLGASSISFLHTKDYVTIMLIGAPAVIANFALEQTVRSEGAAKVSMYGMILSVILNIVLDALFIFVFDWGMKGIAAATMLANLASVVCYGQYIHRKSPFLTLSLKACRVTVTMFRNILSVGVPVFLLSVFMGTTALFFNHFLAIYGDTSVAAFGISSRLMQFPEFIIMGLCEGVIPLIAYCFTANKKRMKEVIQFTAAAVISIAVLCGTIVFFISNHLIGLFTIDQELIATGSYILKIVFLSLFMTGFTLLITGIFQATAQGKAALVMAVAQGVIFIPTLFVMNHYMQFHGVIWSIVIADFMALGIASVLLFVLRNKLTIAPEIGSFEG